MKKQVKVLLLIAMICVLAFATMLVSSALANEQGDNAWQVVGKGYAATLQEAVDGAADADTIKLLKNTTEATVVTLDKNVIIDGQGNTLTFATAAEENKNVIVTATDVKITNITLKSDLTCIDISANAEKGQELSYAAMFAVKAVGVIEFNDVVATGERLVFDYYGTHTKITGSKTNIVTNRQIVWSDKSTAYNNTVAAWGQQKITIDAAGGTVKSNISDGFRLGGAMVEITVKGGYLYCAEDMFYPQGGGSHLTIIGNTTIEVGSNVWANSVKLAVPEGAPTGTVVPVNNIVVGGNITLRTLGKVTAANQGHIFNSENETNYVIGSASGVDALGIADNIVMYAKGSTTNGCASIIKQSSNPTTIKIYSGDYYSRDMNFWFNDVMIDLEIFDGTFMISGIPTSGGYHSNIYHNGKLGSKVVVHYANMGYIRNVDFDTVANAAALVNEHGGTNACPFYAGSGEGVDITIYDGRYYTGATNGPITANKANGKVKIYGGLFGSSTGGGNIQLGTDSKADVYGGTFYAGYAWARPEGAGCTFNMWGGTFYSTTVQENANGNRINGDSTINIYGGTYTFVNNAGTYAKDTNCSLISVQGAGTVNVYGGTFTNFSDTNDSAIIYVGNADGVVNVYAPGTAITDAAGQPAVSTGVTFVRGNKPTIVNNVGGGTVNIQGGTTIKLVNIGCTWAPNYVAAEGETPEVLGLFKGNVTVANTVVGGNTERVKFVLDKTTWCFPADNEWKKNDYDYEINSWRDIPLDDGSLEFSASDSDFEEFYAFDGEFEGDLTPAALNELVYAYIRSMFWDDEDAGLYEYYCMSEEDDGGRVNLTVNLTAPSSFIITKNDYVATGDFGLTYGTLFTVNGGSLTLVDVELESSYFINGPLHTTTNTKKVGEKFSTAYLASSHGAIDVNGGEVVVESGDYAAGGRTPLIALNDGTVSIEGGKFERTKYTWHANNAIIEMKAGNLAISGGTFHSYVGGAFVHFADNWDTAGSNTVVTGGTFTIENAPNSDAGMASLGGIFYAGNGSATERHHGVLTIKDGSFTANGWVRIYALNNVDGDGYQDKAPHAEKKFVANIEGGTFVGNADEFSRTDDRYLFQFARVGHHEINITGGSFSAGINCYFFNANASATGGKVTASNATFDGAQCWVNSGWPMTWSFTNCTFLDTKGISIGNSNSMFRLAGTDTLTLINCTIVLNDNVHVIETNANSNVTITGCNITGTRFMENTSAASFAISDTIIKIVLNEYDENAVIDLASVVMDKVIILVTKDNATASPVADSAKFNTGAYPVVLYGGDEYYAWSTNAASGANAGSVTEIGILNDGNLATSGIKFTSNVPAAVISALTEGGKTVKFGTLVAPADYVVKAGAFTPAALDAAGLQGTAYVKIPAINSKVTDDLGNVTFSGSLINLKSTTRAYAAVAYIEVYSGETLVQTIYGAYSTNANATSAKVAAAAILAAAAPEDLAPWQKALLELYAPVVAE